VSQNQFYRITLLTFYFLFLNSGVIYANIEKPIGEENKILLNIVGKERAYHELDGNGLNYKGVGKNFEMGDSIRIGIYSRSIKAQTGKKIRNYGFTVQIDIGKPQKLKYEKPGDDVISADRPGWNYTEAGVWYVYMPVKKQGYIIKVKPLKGNPVVYLRLTSNDLIKEDKFTEDFLKTVNRQDRWRIQTNEETDSSTFVTTLYWYPLKKNKQLQYEINGPATVRVFTRIEFNNDNPKDNYYVRIREDGYDLGTSYFDTEKSEKSSVSKTGKMVGKWRSLWLNIPKGKHYYTFTLPNIEDNSDKTVYIRLKKWQED